MKLGKIGRGVSIITLNIWHSAHRITTHLNLNYTLGTNILVFIVNDNTYRIILL